MKFIVGAEAGSYTFDKDAGTITITGLPLLILEDILVVTNVTKGIMIYNFAKDTLIGTISSNIITLLYDTSSMANTDKLQIWVNADIEQEATSTFTYDINGVLTQMVKNNVTTTFTYTGDLLTGMVKTVTAYTPPPSTSGTIGVGIIGDTFVIGA